MGHSIKVGFSALFVGVSCLLGTACGEGSMLTTVEASDYASPVVVGQIESPDIKESSGLSASECQDVLWTHNDAGNEELIYAMDLAGKHLGTWRVTQARNVDWESIATYKDNSGKCFLLIADIGDNDENRTDTVVYRIPEPAANASTARSNTSKPLPTDPAQPLQFRYPDGSNNAETVLSRPGTGEVYIVTKKKKGPAGVYKVQPAFGAAQPATAEKVGQIAVPSKPEGLLTGGSISPDGTRVMLCDVKNGYEFVLPAGSANFDSVWQQRPMVVQLGDRKQGEGISYGRDGQTVYASSEKKNTPIYLIKRKG